MPGRRSWLGLRRSGSPPHGRLSFLPKAAQRDAAAAVRDLAHLHSGTDCPVCHRDVPEELRRRADHAT